MFIQLVFFELRLFRTLLKTFLLLQTFTFFETFQLHNLAFFLFLLYSIQMSLNVLNLKNLLTVFVAFILGARVVVTLPLALLLFESSKVIPKLGFHVFNFILMRANIVDHIFYLCLSLFDLNCFLQLKCLSPQRSLPLFTVISYMSLNLKLISV